MVFSIGISLLNFAHVDIWNDSENKHFYMSKKKNRNNKVELFNSVDLILELVFIKPKQFHIDFHFVFILKVHFDNSNQKDRDRE